jgi:ferric-dicitrate binding protein FerR (iron transport regulator)
LGTHFNFNAYDDETSHRVTLLEGKVRVNADNKTVELMPGQQSLYKPNAQHPSSLSKLYDADLEAVMAWKNGEFRLKNVSILELLKQASRWYDVDFVFEFEPEKTNFTGILSRKENVSKLLEVLTATQKVAFRKEGRKIVVIKPLNNEN